jgi:NADH-quinone oxidoreductase subunit J
VTGPGIRDFGIAIFADWVLPFEVLSMLLLAALIGAIVLARRESGESGEEPGATHIELSVERDPDATDRPPRAGCADGGRER